jgi:predicted secreted hydrolase
MELPFAHFAFTDVTRNSFKFYERSSRGAFGEAGFATPPGRIAWMEDWVLEEDDQGRLHLKASAEDQGEGRGIDLILVQQREPLIHGTDGISPKSSKPGHASHYYSLTRLQASGTVTREGRSRQVDAVHGLVWFDHEWASNELDPDEAGWDWSGLYLSNGDDLMIFTIRNAVGKTVFTSGTLRESSGTTHDLKDLELTAESHWKSPHTGGLYPSAWHLKLPSQKLELSLVPKIADQELVIPPFAYWEGAVRGGGTLGTNPVKAEGYFEMTGYGGKILGLSQPSP